MAYSKEFLAMIALCAAITLPGMAVSQENPVQRTLHVAKIVCGTQPDAKNLQFVRGVYATVVNVLNTSGTRQVIALKLALAHPPVSPAPGAVLGIAELQLDTGQAGAVDCRDIETLVYPFGLPDSYIDGFVVIEGEGALSVQAVYTAAPLIDESCCKARPGPVASIDVERIDPVPPPQGAVRMADLLPEPPVLETDPLGAPGTGFCGEQSADGGPPGAVAEIINQGEVAAAASTAQFDFGSYGQSQVPVPPLDPGKMHAIGTPIPVECFGTGRENTCAFDVIADVGGSMEESLETNNKRRGHCLRSMPRGRQ